MRFQKSDTQRHCSNKKSAPLKPVWAVYLLLSVFLAVSAAAQAEDYKWADTDEGTCRITKYTGSGGKITIPDTLGGLTVTEIGSRASHGFSNLTHVTIPDTITANGDDAFNGCNRLTSVTIGPNVTAIGDCPFRNCYRLNTISVAPTNPSYSSLDGVLFDKAQTVLIRCPQARKIADYVLPDSVTTIAEIAFYRCSDLTGVTFGNNVTTIGNSAFACNSLISITIPDSVTTIGDRAFYNCPKLTTITVAPANPSYSSVDGILFDKAQTVLIKYPQAHKTADYVVPDNVTAIGNDAFRRTGLTGVTIGNSVTTIGEEVFFGCRKLTGVTIGNNISTIENYTFMGCTSLTRVTISDSVTAIGDSAFTGCTSLTDVTIPDNVTTIGKHAFRDCTGLTGVTIPDSVTAIGDCVFWGCSGLTDVTIGNSVTTIGRSAFAHCTGLTDVCIGNNVTTFGPSTFRNCPKLTTITVAPANPSYSSLDGVLFDKAQTVLIRCPSGKTGNYFVPDSVTAIGDSAFYRCTGLTGVYFKGDAPTFAPRVFKGVDKATVYYTPGTAGWEKTFGGLPTAEWKQ